MPEFSESSLGQLGTCDLRLVLLAKKAIQFFDFTVLEGHREEEKQNFYYEEGRSEIRWPNGKHNKIPSLAFDLAPYPIDWSNRTKAIARFYLLAGIILTIAWFMGIKLRWGGDWDGDWDLYDQNFDDLGHFELINDEPNTE